MFLGVQRYQGKLGGQEVHGDFLPAHMGAHVEDTLNTCALRACLPPSAKPFLCTYNLHKHSHTPHTVFFHLSLHGSPFSTLIHVDLFYPF